MPESTDASVYFIGNATTIIRCNGFTLLTDPNFLHHGQQARLGWGIRTRRRTEPAMSVADLPPVDLVVLSHLHGDHWDEIAERGLDPYVPIVTTPHAADVLRGRGFGNAIGLETWQTYQVHRNSGVLSITAVPARHAPGPLDRLLPPVMGSVLDFCRGDDLDLRLHISGDTILDPCLAEIPRRFPEIDAAIVHMGGTRIFRVLVSMDGVQGAEWLQLIKPEVALPVHYDDYEAFTSPLSEFQHHVRRLGLTHAVHYLMRGETCRLPLRTRPRPVARPR